jgi:hypothetical protein
MGITWRIGQFSAQTPVAFRFGGALIDYSWYSQGVSTPNVVTTSPTAWITVNGQRWYVIRR